MRASTAFFVGIGTVGLAITGGLGGGLLIGNMMSPSPPKHVAAAAKTEAAKPALPAAQAGQPSPAQPMSPASALPYTAATLAFTDPSINGQVTQADHAVDGGSAAPPPAVAAAAPSQQSAKPVDHPAPRQTVQETQQTPSAKPPSAPEDAYAKARDADLKHAAERRRAEPAQRWVGRHGYDRGQDQAEDQNQKPNRNADQQARDDRNIDRSSGSANRGYGYSDRAYRDDGRGRYRDAERDDDDRRPRYFVDEGPRVGFPRFELFGPDD